MGRTFQYNSGCWKVASVAGIIRKVLFGLVLEDAIVREENSNRFYEAAQKKVEGEDALQLLKKLCAEELRHRLKLEELQKTGESEEIEISTQAEIELFDEKEQPWPEVNSRSTCRDILILALAKEKQAAAYYRTIAGRTSLRSVEDLFHMLAGEESEHARWVEQMLAGAR